MSAGLDRLGPRLVLAAGVSAVLLVTALVATGGDARAQSAPSVISTSMTVNFPRNVEFNAIVENEDALEEAVLLYTVLPEGAQTRTVATITRGDVSRLAAAMPTVGSAYVPAGADVAWRWQLTPSDGQIIETPPEVFRYEDPRFDWQVISVGPLRLHYYENEAIAQDLADQGADAIALIADLLGIDAEIDFPIKLYMWSNTEDAQGVERTESQGFEELVITGGTRVLADLVHIFQPSVWVVRHELTHVLTKIAGEGGIGSLPSWLDEGTATFAEVDWRRRRGRALDFAIQNDLLLTVRSMGSNTNIPGRVDIFYGQSGALVTFLINEFGEERFAELFRVFRAGSTVDNALMTVYGIDRDALDDAFRESVGLEPVVRGEDRSTVIEDEDVPAASGETESEEAGDAASEGAEDEPATAGTEAAAAVRGDDEVAGRQAEIERRQSTRRPGPVFSSGSEFPWEGVVTGVAGATLLLSLFTLVLVLSRSAAPASTPEGLMMPPGSGSSSPWAGWRADEGASASGEAPRSGEADDDPDR